MPTIQDLNDWILSAASDRVAERLNEISVAQEFIANGLGPLAETTSRLEQFARREVEIEASESLSKSSAEEIGLEKLIGKSDDKLSIEFLEKGVFASKSVGRVRNDSWGTCFHVGHQIILTNNHVYSKSDEVTAALTEIEFNVEQNTIGKNQPKLSYEPNPKRFFLTNAELDFTLVAVHDPLEENPPLEELGWHALLKVQGKIRVGDPVNIIQHPDGRDKAVVVHNSHLLHLENDTNAENFCWYSGDTDEGSSGSPVFNNRWEIIALHHKAVPKTNQVGEILDREGQVMSEAQIKNTPEDIAWVANEGIRVSRIVQALQDASFENEAHSEIRDELIKLWSAPKAHQRGLRAAVVKA